jgi:aminoglycoside/choline kinase family phosphotransferase
MGLQRNLKVVGIFARLRYRDQKQGYLEMIPMFYRYLLDVFPGYPEFDTFLAILEDESCAP